MPTINEQLNLKNAQLIVSFQKSIFTDKHSGLKKPYLKYLSGAIKRGGTTEVKYLPPTECKKCGLDHGGRYNPKNGIWLGSMMGSIRSTLHEGTSWDYDMKCCHPSLVSQYCKKQTPFIPTPVLDKYINDYDKIKTKYPDSKYAVLGFLNGGGFNKYNDLKGNKLFESIKKEIDGIYKKIIYQKWGSHIESLEPKKQHHRFRHLCACFTQNLERITLEAFHRACENTGIHVNTLIHDGCLLGTKLSRKQITDLESEICQETGYELKVAYKDHSSEVINFEEFDEDLVVSNDKEAAEIIKEKFHGNTYVKTPEGLLVVNHGIWDSNPMCLISNVPQIFKKNSKDELIPFSYNASGASGILKFVNAITPVDNDFIYENNLKTKGKIYFIDKYWDLANQSWHEHDCVPMVRIERDAPVSNIKKYFDYQSDNDKYHPEVQEVFDLFNNPFDEDVGIYFLQAIARAAGGNVQDKIWYAMKGPRHAGKGGTQTLIRAVMEQYCTTGTIPVLRKTSGDEAQKNRWILTTNQHKARINFTNELAKPGKEDPILDGNLIKGITANGGEDLVLTRNHGKGEVMVRVNTTTFCALNNFPKCSPADALQTLRILDFPNNFQEKDRTCAADKKPLGMEISRWVSKKNRVDAMFYLIVSNYLPHSLMKVDPPESCKIVADEINSKDISDPISAIKLKYLLDPTGRVDYLEVFSSLNKFFKSSNMCTRFLKKREFKIQTGKYKAHDGKYYIGKNVAGLRPKPIDEEESLEPSLPALEEGTGESES